MRGNKWAEIVGDGYLTRHMLYSIIKCDVHRCMC